jgi:hypothetical protein
MYISTVEFLIERTTNFLISHSCSINSGRVVNLCCTFIEGKKMFNGLDMLEFYFAVPSKILNSICHDLA